MGYRRRCSTDLKVKCSFTAIRWMIGSSKPFWACVYASSSVHCFQFSHYSLVSMTSSYCSVRFRHLNCTAPYVIIILDFITRVNVLPRTLKFLCLLCFFYRHLQSLTCDKNLRFWHFPCETVEIPVENKKKNSSLLEKIALSEELSVYKQFTA